MLNGIDIAGSYQGDLNPAEVDADFIIIKATQGTTFNSPRFKEQANQTLQAGKLLGVYHYVGGGNAAGEVNFFVNAIREYIGKAMIFIDWEAGQNSAWGNVGYLKTVLDGVKAQTGVTPVVYMSKEPTRSGMASVANYYLWGAQYANNNNTGYQSRPWTDAYGWGPWQGPIIYQYSSHGRINGYGRDLDLDLAYFDRAQWLKYAGAKPTKPVTDSLVKEVLDGKWSNGNDRVKRLSEAGYNAYEVQARVNAKLAPIKSIDELVIEVLDGKWGNGEDRVKRLKKAGYDAQEVQDKVNSKLGAGATYYTVQAGDNLTTIAAKFGTNWQNISRLNGLVNANLIYPGQRLRVK